MDSRVRGNGGVFFRALGDWDGEFPRARELWIPAFAGMTVSVYSIPEVIDYGFPRWTGDMNSRARGNSPSHYPQCPKKHSATPAKAGIQPITRHSHESGNPTHQPSFP